MVGSGWGRAPRPGSEAPPAPSTRSANGMLMNMMVMSDENHRDIYISTVAVPPPGRCAACRDASRARPGEGWGPGAPGRLLPCPAATAEPAWPVSLQVTRARSVCGMASCCTPSTRWSTPSPLSSPPSSSRRTRWCCSTPATLWWPAPSRCTRQVGSRVCPQALHTRSQPRGPVTQLLGQAAP